MAFNLLDGYAFHIVSRYGTSDNTPALIMGELGFDTDTRVFRVGNDTAIPEKIMTTSTNIALDFSTTPQVTFSDIVIKAGSKVAGLDLNDVITSGSGILAHLGAGNMASRQIVSGDGSINVSNPGGVAGNIDIRIQPSLIQGFLSSVVHDSSLDGNGSLSYPLSVVQATTTTLGGVTRASDEEVDNGTDATKYVTPDSLNKALVARGLPRNYGILANVTIGGTYSLPSPVGVNGATISVWNNNNASTLTVSTPTGNIVGPGVTANASFTLYTNRLAVFQSDGSSWVIVSADNDVTTDSGGSGSGGVTVITSATPPGSPSIGMFWFNTTDNVLYMYVYNGVSNLWIDISTSGGSTNIFTHYGADTSVTANTIVATVTPGITSYVAGHIYYINIAYNVTNSSATINLNVLGARGILRGNSAPIVDGDIKAGINAFTWDPSQNKFLLAHPTFGYIQNVITGINMDAYLPKSGGTMTGPLTLAADAVSQLQAVTLQQMINSLSTLKIIGNSQTWQTVTRTTGTVYQNTTGKPIMVAAAIYNNGHAEVSSDGTTFVSLFSMYVNNNTYISSFSFIVPAGHYYKFTGNGTSQVAELR